MVGSQQWCSWSLKSAPHHPHPTPTLIFHLSVSDCTSGESCTSDFACIPKSSICDGKPNCFMAEDEHCKGKATGGCVLLSNKAYNKCHTLWNILKQFCESLAQMFLRFDINDTSRMIAIVVCANWTICPFQATLIGQLIFSSAASNLNTK